MFSSFQRRYSKCRQTKSRCEYYQNKYYGQLWETMGRIAENSPDKHLYTFITSDKGGEGYAGWGNVGVLCGKKYDRVSINRYWRGQVKQTAKVTFIITFYI